jgi:hypothetical protein
MEERSLFKYKKIQSGKRGWYVRLFDEKKAGYMNKLRVSRLQKKAAAALAVNVDEPPSSLIGLLVLQLLKI